MIARTRHEAGFTLTELMFAMAFVAFILIFIVTSIVQTMRIYNKGLAIREINQVGRQIGEEMSRTLRYANATQFATTGYPVNTAPNPDEPYQRLCVNGVSYIWNVEGAAGLVIKNRYAAPDASTPIRFIRVEDRTGSLCANPTSDIPKTAATNVRELLTPQLTLQRLSVTPRENGKIAVINLVVSTAGANRPDGPGRPTPTGFECKTSGEGAFCAFGDFQTTVYIRN